MPAVVSEGYRFGQRYVESARAGNAACHLRYFERMGEPGALMVARKDEHLGLSGESPERGAVENAVTVTLEAGSNRVGFLLTVAIAGTVGVCGAFEQQLVLAILPFGAK